jgi:predicted RNA methylase
LPIGAIKLVSWVSSRKLIIAGPSKIECPIGVIKTGTNPLG